MRQASGADLHRDAIVIDGTRPLFNAQAVHPCPRNRSDAQIKEQLAVRRWSAEAYSPPPHHCPTGMSTPKELPDLTAKLLKHGYNATQTRKILGENWLRVMRAVWGD